MTLAFQKNCPCLTETDTCGNNFRRSMWWVEFDSRSAWQGEKRGVTQHGACCTPHKEPLKTTTWWPSGLFPFCVSRSKVASQLLSCRTQMKATFTHLSKCPYHGCLNQYYIIWVKVLPAAAWGTLWMSPMNGRLWCLYFICYFNLSGIVPGTWAFSK